MIGIMIAPRANPGSIALWMLFMSSVNVPIAFCMSREMGYAVPVCQDFPGLYNKIRDVPDFDVGVLSFTL